MSSAPVGAYFPGTLSTGVKNTPQAPFKGAGFDATKLTMRLTTAPSGAGTTTATIRKNGTSMGTVTLTDMNQATTVISPNAISDADYFDIEILTIQATPGGDLTWNVAP